MTDAEAMKLRPGDPLLGVISGRLAVLETVEFVGKYSVRARRIGKTAIGGRYPPVVRTTSHLCRLPRPDVPAFHVAADWLDEHDEPVAAAKLRRAFPLNGEG